MDAITNSVKRNIIYFVLCASRKRKRRIARTKNTLGRFKDIPIKYTVVNTHKDSTRKRSMKRWRKKKFWKGRSRIRN